MSLKGIKYNGVPMNFSNDEKADAARVMFTVEGNNVSFPHTITYTAERANDLYFFQGDANSTIKSGCFRVTNINLASSQKTITFNGIVNGAIYEIVLRAADESTNPITGYIYKKSSPLPSELILNFDQQTGTVTCDYSPGIVVSDYMKGCNVVAHLRGFEPYFVPMVGYRFSLLHDGSSYHTYYDLVFTGIIADSSGQMYAANFKFETQDIDATSMTGTGRLLLLG